MKATFENCYEITNKMHKNFSNRALSVVADSVEDLCDKLARNGVFEYDIDEGAEIDEKILKAIIIREVSKVYRMGVMDAYEAMSNAASKLI